MRNLNWKTKMWLDLQGDPALSGGGGGSETYTLRDQKQQPIITIPTEANQLLEAAWMLIQKANASIEQDKNLTY